MPHMYILECADGSYYTGSTWDLERRLVEHQSGIGARHTAKRLPVKLVYCEYYDRVEDAYHREKQVQGWSRKKKRALIEQNPEKLIEYSRNYTQYPPEPAASTGSAADKPLPPRPEPDFGELSRAVEGRNVEPPAEPVEAGTLASTTLASTSSASEPPRPEPRPEPDFGELSRAVEGRNVEPPAEPVEAGTLASTSSASEPPRPEPRPEPVEGAI